MEDDFAEAGGNNRQGGGGKKNNRKNKKGKNNVDVDADIDSSQNQAAAAADGQDDQEDNKASIAKRKEQQAKILADMAAGGGDDDSDDDPIFGKKGKKNQKKGKQQDNKRQRQGKKGKKGGNDEEDDEDGEESKGASASAAASMADFEEEEKKGDDNGGEETYPLQVIYCPRSGLPPEYLEFASKDVNVEEDKAWLKQNHPELYDELFAVVEGEGGDDGTSAAAAGQKKKGKKKVGFAGDAEKKIRVIKQKRGGKKFTSSIVGLDKYGCDLTAVAKIISKRCGTGAAAMLIEFKEIKEEGIQVQGDVSDKMEELLTVDLKEYDIPFEKVVMEDGGNKKNRTMGGGR